jgi:dTDP-4-dehydrorhamnose 3,5-epimerase
MKFIPTGLTGAFIIEPNILQDERGAFFRTFCKDEFKTIGHEKEFVQMNHSITAKKGTVRGMHFQSPPFSEIKLIRCVRGEVYDVIVDLRKGSPTFLKWFGAVLSAENKKMMYVPEGFAHGFQTQEENSELVYCHTQFYTPAAESGLNTADEKLNIVWPLPVTFLSERDQQFSFIDKNFTGISV